MEDPAPAPSPDGSHREPDENSPLIADASPTPVGSIIGDDEVPISSRVQRRLYVSHFLSAWNARVFEFGSVLYLAALFPGTLMPLSVYAMVRGMGAILLTSPVGSYIDHTDRLRVVRMSIVLQRLSVAASCAILYSMAVQTFGDNDVVTVAQFAALCLLACVEKVAAGMNTTAVEKDWVPTICDGNRDETKYLSAKLRRIDLFCKLVGPLFIAQVDVESTWLAILVNFGMNLLSIPVEYICIARVYHEDPKLQRPKSPTSSPLPSIADTGDDALPFPIPSLQPAPPSRLSPSRLWTALTTTIHRTRADFAMHATHPIFRPSLALALCYFTVLSFSGRMVAYLLSMGYTSQQIAFSRTTSTILEMCATWAAPWLMGRIGNARAALWFSSWQLSWLATGWGVSYALLHTSSGGSNLALQSAVALVAGTVMSRMGLGGFDACASNIVQLEVEESRRGTFTSVEYAYANAFEMLSYATTLVFSRPDQFLWPALMSLVAIAGCWALQAEYVRRVRGHLVHVPTFIKLRRARLQSLSRGEGGGAGEVWSWVSGSFESEADEEDVERLER